MLKKSPENALRVLGPSEHYFWLSNQTSPKHFVVAAQIGGFTKVASWQVAFTAVQQRHPLLQVCIAEDQVGAPYFRRLNEPGIPLRVVHGSVSENWEQEVSRELATALPLKGGPLVRVALMHEENRSTVIVSAHHSIADGLSLTFIVRDLLRALSGGSLEKLQLTPSQEDLCEAPGAAPVGVERTHRLPGPLDRDGCPTEAGQLPLSKACACRRRFPASFATERVRNEPRFTEHSWHPLALPVGRFRVSGWRSRFASYLLSTTESCWA